MTQVSWFSLSVSSTGCPRPHMTHVNLGSKPQASASSCVLPGPSLTRAPALSPLRCTRGPAPPPRPWERLPSMEDPVRGFLAGTRRSSENQEPLLCVSYLLPRRLIWVPEALCPPTFRLLRLPWLVTAYAFCAFTSRAFLRLVSMSTSLNQAHSEQLPQ